MKQPTTKKITDGLMPLPGYLLESGASAGTIKIHEGTIATIVKRSALSVEGVARISGSSLIDNIAELVGSKKIQDRAIAVTFSEGSVVSVELAINVLFGYNLPKVAESVQKTVIDAIREMTGLNIAGVNVNIREIDDPAPDSNPSEKGEL